MPWAIGSCDYSAVNGTAMLFICSSARFFVGDTLSVRQRRAFSPAASRVSAFLGGCFFFFVRARCSLQFADVLLLQHVLFLPPPPGVQPSTSAFAFCSASSRPVQQLPGEMFFSLNARFPPLLCRSRSSSAASCSRFELLRVILPVSGWLNPWLTPASAARTLPTFIQVLLI